MTIKIEKNVEVPFDWRSSINPYRDAIENMEVDDSFKYPLTDINAIRGVLNTYQRKSNKKFITRKISETERRVWRSK